MWQAAEAACIWAEVPVADRSAEDALREEAPAAPAEAAVV